MSIMTDQPFVKFLRFYPIKSCGVVELSTLYAGPRGFSSGAIGDRSWMVVNAEGALISQREKSELARVKVELVYDDAGVAQKLRISADGMPPLVLDPALVGDERQKVVIHKKDAVAHKAPEEISAWFSGFLGENVHVVHQKEDDVRLCDPAFAVNADEDAVSFGDGFPYLVVNEGTRAELNARLDEPVPMDRFRANIIIGGAPSEAEYTWKALSTGDGVSMMLVKPCTRCIMTTIDQDTGEKTGKQPLAALAATNFLSQDYNGVRVQGTIFGENAIATSYGNISVGDPVIITETKPMHTFRRKVPVPS